MNRVEVGEIFEKEPDHVFEWHKKEKLAGIKDGMVRDVVDVKRIRYYLS